MSDEIEMKLACLHHAGGNLDHAKDLFAWVSGKQESTPDADFETGYWCGLQDSRTCPGSESGRRGHEQGARARKWNLELDRLQAQERERAYDALKEFAAKKASDVAIAALSPMPEAGEGETSTYPRVAMNARCGEIIEELVGKAPLAQAADGTLYALIDGRAHKVVKREQEYDFGKAITPQPQPDHLAEFLKRPGAVLHVTNMQPVADEVEVVVLRRDGEVLDQGNAVGRNAACYRWDESHPHSLDYPNDIIAYAPAQPATPEQGLSEIENTEGEIVSGEPFPMSAADEKLSAEIESGVRKTFEIPQGYERHLGGPCPTGALVPNEQLWLMDRHCKPFRVVNPLNYNWEHTGSVQDILAYRRVTLDSEPSSQESSTDAAEGFPEPALPAGFIKLHANMEQMEAMAHLRYKLGHNDYTMLTEHGQIVEPRSAGTSTADGAYHRGGRMVAYRDEATKTPSELETQGSADGDREEQTNSPDSSDAQVFAHGILKDAERKASEPKHSVIGRLFGGTKSFAKPEGAL